MEFQVQFVNPKDGRFFHKFPIKAINTDELILLTGLAIVKYLRTSEAARKKYPLRWQ